MSDKARLAIANERLRQAVAKSRKDWGHLIDVQIKLVAAKMDLLRGKSNG